MSLMMRMETEHRLRQEAERQGQDVDTLLNVLLDEIARERSAEAAGIQRGLTDVSAGRTRPFADFLSEHQQKRPPVGQDSVSA